MDDPVILSRLQFALTVMFHYIFPPLTIGLGVLLVVMEGMWLKTGNDLYHKLAKFWTRMFGIIFALGVASGIVMEFQFGTNWADYSRYVGDIFGSALAAEGIFAFFLESGFLALLLFGWDKVGKKLHFFSTCMVSLGAHFSAIWIIVANSWMQTPDGYKIVETAAGPRAEMTSFVDVVLNPSTVDRLTHALSGCWLAGATLVLSVSAWYILRGRFVPFAKAGMKIALVIGMIAVAGMGLTGDSSAREVALQQPTKFAAMEGVFETGSHLPLHIFGILHGPNHDFTGFSVPDMLSILTHGSADAEIKGLNAFPQEDLPPVAPVFYSFHIMILIGCMLAGLMALGLLGWWKGWLFRSKWLMWCFVFSVLAPQIGNQVGWAVAELGRQPWIVYGMLRTKDAVSPTLTSGQAIASLAMFGVIYALLLALFIYQISHKIHKGPDGVDEFDDTGQGRLHIPFIKE
ncbi:cytochrome ubiquinol oxidase subunit I [Akkermansia sp. N21169]|jgi:cytochrome d ubiquinol oxidase subunit I|uniref:cytochrome ubiquinol oxidase subunit I n=1 Tax=Akkermansia sp. N21169 TaxID=3040765 RepID=UPI00244E6277|nr:cytochrome ubiquinol oxidase subunit I [Akkermansia sp. N21169]MDH3068128.1 cytochrome ubiquinol oxidase subunit I [Akkermansia sp. N21169]